MRDHRNDTDKLMDDFWLRALGDDARRVREDEEAYEPTPYLHGFIDGAVELWEEVRGEV